MVTPADLCVLIPKGLSHSLASKSVFFALHLGGAVFWVARRFCCYFYFSISEALRDVSGMGCVRPFGTGTAGDTSSWGHRECPWPALGGLLSG